MVTTRNSSLCAFSSLPIEKQKQINKSNNRETENSSDTSGFGEWFKKSVTEEEDVLVARCNGYAKRSS